MANKLQKVAFTRNESVSWSTPNSWDILALLIIFGVIVVFVWGAKQMTTPYDLGQIVPISLDPTNLPKYAVRTVLRMFIALFFSLVFTFVFGAWAAKNKRAEKIIIPIIDVMQSIPVLTFLSITLVAFIALFRGSMLGPECAAIFAVFTGQVWNMTLSFYQSVSTVPKDLREVSKIFNLSTWQTFWRIEVPFAMPGLLWNMMMSMSGSWFFVTASEAFSVANQNITLPGIGSYIALAIAHANATAIFYAILAMLTVILFYDQLLFRPLVYLTDKFKFEQVLDEPSPKSWIVNLFQRTKFLWHLGYLLELLFDAFINNKLLSRKKTYRAATKIKRKQKIIYSIVNSLLWISIIAAIIIIGYYFANYLTNWRDIREVIWLGFLTGVRVMTLIIICSFIWVPIGVWIGLKPRVATIAQPIVQFLAAFPANLLYPIFAFLIVKYSLNVNIWASPLAVLGTQWYILFNVIAGASALPQELRLTIKNFNVTGWLWWKRLILPGILPYFITGAITAAGGAWNASIIAEIIHWGTINLQAKGLGAYINTYSVKGDFMHIALGTIVMCLYVLLINRLVWRPLYNFTIERFRLD
jgi:NitT/TauT family transport system permease protein